MAGDLLLAQQILGRLAHGGDPRRYASRVIVRHALGERVEAGEAGHGSEGGVVGPDAAEEPAQFGQRLPAGRLDRPQRLSHLRGPLVERVAGGRCLDRHDAHAVADDVVHLAPDPGLLLGGRPFHVGLALGLEPGGALATRAQVVAQQPRRAEGRERAQRLPGPEIADAQHEQRQRDGGGAGRLQRPRPPDVGGDGVERDEWAGEQEVVVREVGGERGGERDGEDGDWVPAAEDDRQRRGDDQEHEADRPPQRVVGRVHRRRRLGWGHGDTVELVAEQHRVLVLAGLAEDDTRPVDPRRAGRPRCPGRPLAGGRVLHGQERHRLPGRLRRPAVAEHRDLRVPAVAWPDVPGRRRQRPVLVGGWCLVDAGARLDQEQRREREHDREQRAPEERKRSPAGHLLNLTPGPLVHGEEPARPQGRSTA